MNRDRLCRWLTLPAVALLWLAGCAPSPTLTVGVHPWVGYEPLYLAREMKWLPEQIQLREVTTLNDSLAALRSGEAAAACMTLDEMLRARAEGIPLSAALVFDVSAGADAVLARPEIRKLADLAGKRVAYDHGTVGALVFEKLLDAAGLPRSAIVQLDLPPERQLEAWRRKEVDAVITYEPMTTAFTHEGARTLFDSRQVPDTIIDVLAVRRDRPDVIALVKALAASHFRAVRHMRTNEQDFVLRVSARENVGPEEARRMLAGVSFPSLAANRAYVDGNDSRLAVSARLLSSLMERRGLLAREDDLRELTLAGLLPAEEW